MKNVNPPRSGEVPFPLVPAESRAKLSAALFFFASSRIRTAVYLPTNLTLESPPPYNRVQEIEITILKLCRVAPCESRPGGPKQLFRRNDDATLG